VSAAFALDRVTVRYPGSAMPQLADATLAVREGECVAIVGPNGAGKTTALRALLGVAPLSSGRATIMGTDVAAWDRAALAREVAVVGQREEPAFPITVAELAAMGRYPHLGPWRSPDAADRVAVDRALARTDVLDLKDRWVQTLSGGEWQRVRLARALAQEPRALVLDEPTSSLDLRHEMELFEIVAGLGIPSLMVSHNVNAAARFATRLVLMSQGRIVADDVPGRVLDAGLLTQVYGWPVAVHRLPDGSVQLYPERQQPSAGARAR
jgi:iron complex transport system ATP-binding protein